MASRPKRSNASAYRRARGINTEAATRFERFSGRMRAIYEYNERCTPIEWKVFSHIVRRTIYFDKLAEVIPITHFLEPLAKKDGTHIHGACGASRAQIYKALKSLKEKGFIRIIQGKDRSMYEILLPGIREGGKSFEDLAELDPELPVKVPTKAKGKFKRIRVGPALKPVRSKR